MLKEGEGFTCPFCGTSSFDLGKVTKTFYLCHDGEFKLFYNTEGKGIDSAVTVKISKCPHCGEVSYSVSPYWNSDKFTLRYPSSLYQPVPDYVPQAIRDDFYEACAIVDLSPKASATLSRRCLQGMIRDFWQIREKDLYTEISALQGKVPAKQWRTIDALRHMGNIGAHMGMDVNLIVDVDANEAQNLIELLNTLIKEWYVERYEQERLYADIIAAAENKKAQRR